MLGSTDPGQLGSVGLVELDRLARAINEHYEFWKPAPIAGPPVFYSGTSIGLEVLDARGGSYLLTSLLYYPRLAVHDPLAKLISFDRAKVNLPAGPRQGPESNPSRFEMAEYQMASAFLQPERDWTALRESFLRTMSVLHALRPLIESGIVLLVPEWVVIRRRQGQIRQEMKKDVADDELWNFFEASTPDQFPHLSDYHMGGIRAQDTGSYWATDRRTAVIQPASFYLNKVLTIQEEAKVRYVPTTLADQQMLAMRQERVKEELRARSHVDLHIANELKILNLPLFRDATPTNIVAMRRDESAFEDFRQSLGTLFRDSEDEDPSEFTKVWRQSVEDWLNPRIREIERTVGVSTYLGQRLRDVPSKMIVGAVTATSGMVTSGNVIQTLAPALTTFVTSELIALMRRKEALTGSSLVISALLQD